jgi:hypothetical protein
MKYVLYVLLFLLTHLAFAQDDQTLKKIESARIALITERLELTPEQAEKFWPLYREYSSQREGIRKEFMEARREVKNEKMTEEQSKKLIEKGLQLKERQLHLEKIYSEKFNTVITSRQILLLRKAEDDFRQMLLDRLEHRKEQRDRMQRKEDLKNNN